MTKDPWKTFEFNGYGPSGEHFNVNIEALNEDDAWDFFENVYGNSVYVDQVFCTEYEQ